MARAHLGIEEAREPKVGANFARLLPDGCPRLHYGAEQQLSRPNETTCCDPGFEEK